jgi:hypothetical protein
MGSSTFRPLYQIKQITELYHMEQALSKKIRASIQLVTAIKHGYGSVPVL